MRSWGGWRWRLQADVWQLPGDAVGGGGHGGVEQWVNINWFLGAVM